MVVLPRMSRMTTSRAFLSAAAAAMTPARSVDVIRFALCIVPILAVHPCPLDERGDDVGRQPLERQAPGGPTADVGCADVGRIDGEQGGSGGGIAKPGHLPRVERRRTGPVDDD